jgi:hypothetical protein
VVDVNINAENSKIGNINLTQECGAQLACYKTDAFGNLVAVDCNATAEQQAQQLQQGQQNNEDQVVEENNRKALRITFIVIGAVVVILLIVGLILLLRARN